MDYPLDLLLLRRAEMDEANSKLECCPGSLCDRISWPFSALIFCLHKILDTPTPPDYWRWSRPAVPKDALF
jgi:hypothetical protein